MNLPQPPIREPISGLLQVGWLAYFTQLTGLLSDYATKITGLIANNTGVNTGNETTASIKSKLGITTLSGSNTGDQYSITGITGTISQFNAALLDGDFVTGGGIVTGVNTGDNSVNTLYSGLVSNATHTGDVTGATALTIANKAVTLVKMDDMATASLIYRKTAGVGVPEINTLAALKIDLALVKSDVGLSSVDNTTDLGKPVSTAQQAALNLKASLISPSFTTPALGTPASGNLTNCTFPTLNQNTSGTAAKATILETARAIFGQSFDGSVALTGAATANAFIPNSSTVPTNGVYQRTTNTLNFATNSGGRFEINPTGNIGIGTAPATSYNFILANTLTGATTAIANRVQGVIQSDVTTLAVGNSIAISTLASSFTCGTVQNIRVDNCGLGSGSAITEQDGYFCAPLSGATTNIAFKGTNVAGANSYNLYMGTAAANYLAGDLQLAKTVTAAGTTGAQTINKTTGTVNFAAAATSLVVTNSLCTVNSIILCSIGTNDATMTSYQVVAGSGSFTIYAKPASPTAETRVNFKVTN